MYRPEIDDKPLYNMYKTGSRTRSIRALYGASMCVLLRKFIGTHVFKGTVPEKMPIERQDIKDVFILSLTSELENYSFYLPSVKDVEMPHFKSSKFFKAIVPILIHYKFAGASKDPQFQFQKFWEDLSKSIKKINKDDAPSIGGVREFNVQYIPQELPEAQPLTDFAESELKKMLKKNEHDARKALKNAGS